MRTLDWASLDEGLREEVLRRPALRRSAELSRAVEKTLASVRERGDSALLELTLRYDRARLSSIEAGREEVRRAYREIDPADLDALKEAARRIGRFHQAQLPRALREEVSPGVVCERRFVPIQRVGLYAPGGSAVLPSTVLMLGVPARLAGCPLRVLASPPREDGSLDPSLLVAADLAGIERVFKLGGAQAVAALAYGTQSVPKTDKIFGPGNAWVTEAKLQVARDPEGAACDLPAGPSEVLVIADAGADPELVAADLLAQAEHGEDSQAVLVTTSRQLARRVAQELALQVSGLPREAVARAALDKSLTFLVPDLDAAFEVSNRYAPEHLILQIPDPRSWAKRILNAGSVFLGPWSPEAAGDYASGTNHVLPTYGFARAFGGLTVESFMKPVTFQELSAQGLRELGPVVERLAALERLDAHRLSVSRRLARLEALR